MNLLFEKATQKDIPVIFSQAKELIDQYEDLSSIDYEKVMAWVQKKIETNIDAYTAVSRDGQICSYYHLRESGELDDLYVLPGFRGSGIGTQILEKCGSDSSRSLWLYVFSGNTRAISFYERCGFTLRETVSKTRLIMEKRLTG